MATGTWQQTFTYCYSLSPSSVSFDGCSVPVSFLNLEEELLAWIKMPRQRGLCSSSQTDMCSRSQAPGASSSPASVRWPHRLQEHFQRLRVTPWPAHDGRRWLPTGRRWLAGERASFHTRVNGSCQWGGGFSNPLSPFQQRTRPEPDTGSCFQEHLSLRDHVEETGLGSASSHAPTLCHTVLRPWHKRPQAAFFARRLIIALPRAVFLQSLGNVSPFLSFLFLSRVYK